MADVIMKGTILFDENPVSRDAINTGEDISFGDTLSQNDKLVFVSVNNLLISTRTICRNVSWDQLNKQGYIYGRPVVIDRTQFLCRSLHVGVGPGDPNEWDVALDAVGESDCIWHWQEAYFWGIEKSVITNGADDRTVRGGKASRHFAGQDRGRMVRSVGFRPVLEYLSPRAIISRGLLKKKVKVYGPGGYITGFLKDFSDYDLILANTEGYPVPPQNIHRGSLCNPWLCAKEKHETIINRSAIIWIQEE